MLQPFNCLFQADHQISTHTKLKFLTIYILIGALLHKRTFFFCGGFCADPPTSPLPSPFSEREKPSELPSSEQG